MKVVEKITKYELPDDPNVLGVFHVAKGETVGDLVRCKDCKHRPIKPNDYKDGFDLDFPDDTCPCQCEDGWYSWYPSDNWFCGNGERRTDDA